MCDVIIRIMLFQIWLYTEFITKSVLALWLCQCRKILFWSESCSLRPTACHFVLLHWTIDSFLRSLCT